MRVRALVLSAIAVTMLVAVSGCSAVSALQPKATVVTQEGPVAAPDATVTGDLPAGLPEDLPLWPKGVVKDGDVDDDGNATLALETTASIKDVVAGVGVGFERAGWNVVESLEDETSTVLEVANDDYEGLVTITSGEDVGTSIEYVISPSK